MLRPSTAISTIVIATAAAVQGASLSERAGCPTPDLTRPECQTSAGSPNVADCQKAINQIRSRCYQNNYAPSLCETLVTVGTCKIDVCGQYKSQLIEDVNCGGYLQNILNTCQSGGRVGGRIYPAKCNVDYHYWYSETDDQKKNLYHLQFSHS